MSGRNDSSNNPEETTDAQSGIDNGKHDGTLPGGLSQQPAHYVLRLFVTGTTPQSARAISNIKALCESNIDGRYELEIVDIYQQPELARSEQIIAAPTLIKRLPLPLRKLIGNLSDMDRVLVGLGLQPAEAE